MPIRSLGGATQVPALGGMRACGRRQVGPSVAQDWSASDTWRWVPPSAGSNSVQVWARNAGSSSTFDAWNETSVLHVTGATSLSVSSVTLAPMSPLLAHEPAVVAAAATGGTGPYTYQF